MEGREFVHPVLVELALDEAQRQRRAVNRYWGDVLELRQDVGDRADVVLMPVRDHDGAKVGEALLDVRHVRDDQIDSALFFFRKLAAAVEQDDVPSILDERHVLPDLAHTAQRDDPQTPGGSLRRRGPLVGSRARARRVVGRQLGVSILGRPPRPTRRRSGARALRLDPLKPVFVAVWPSRPQWPRRSLSRPVLRGFAEPRTDLLTTTRSRPTRGAALRRLTRLPELGLLVRLAGLIARGARLGRSPAPGTIGGTSVAPAALAVTAWAALLARRLPTLWHGSGGRASALVGPRLGLILGLRSVGRASAAAASPAPSGTTGRGVREIDVAWRLRVGAGLLDGT